MKKKIAFICSRLDLPGGIERATVNNANLFSQHGHEVTIVIPDESPASFYPVDEGVSIIQASLHFGITEKGTVFSRKLDFLQHIRQLKKIFQSIQADIYISTEYSLTIVTYLAARRLDAAIIGWEHHHFYWLKKNRFWAYLFRTVYPKLDIVVCNNRTEKELFEAIGCKATVIPYMVPDKDKRQAMPDAKIILSIGWLIKRKGVDLIPDIALKLFPKHKDWKWRIIGEGEEFAALRQQIKKYELDAYIEIMPPVSHQLDEAYLSASIFVMTSRFECLPMVLLEASSHGLPCVAFNCPTGPADIIHTGKDGFITPLEDTAAMAEAIEALITNEELRKQMGIAAYESSKRYLPEKIYLAWNEMFEQL